MKLIHGPLRVASLGTLALTLFLAGCGGGSPGFGGMAAGPDLTPVGSNMVAGGVQDDASPDACKVVSASQNFNNHGIQVGRWIWFSSIFTARGVSNNEILVRDSKITFTTRRRVFNMDAPNMRLYIRGVRRARLGWNRGWIEETPNRHKGEIFADGVPMHLKYFVPGGTKNVTWSARFYARHIEKFSWQWGAAVYTDFSNGPMKLRVKPTRYFDKNADPAGTPLAFISDLVPGGTGSGGKDYTGGLSPAVQITPCR